jgi:hypothetical protein
MQAGGNQIKNMGNKLPYNSLRRKEQDSRRSIRGYGYDKIFDPLQRCHHE